MKEAENNEKDRIAEIPYIVYESAQSRMERTNKRLIVALIIAIALMFATNAIWLWAWMQYDYVYESTDQSVDVDAKDGIANYIGNDGDIINGKDKSESEISEGYSEEEGPTEGVEE